MKNLNLKNPISKKLLVGIVIVIVIILATGWWVWENYYPISEIYCDQLREEINTRIEKLDRSCQFDENCKVVDLDICINEDGDITEIKNLENLWAKKCKEPSPIIYSIQPLYGCKCENNTCKEIQEKELTAIEGEVIYIGYTPTHAPVLQIKTDKEYYTVVGKKSEGIIELEGRKIRATGYTYRKEVTIWEAGIPQKTTRNFFNIIDFEIIGITITTDKTEYEQGKTVMITVSDNLPRDINICAIPGFIMKLQPDGTWKSVYLSLPPPTPLCFGHPGEKIEEVMGVTRIEANNQHIITWDQKIISDDGASRILAEGGRYRVRLSYTADVYFTRDTEWKEIYSNEFTIK